MKDVSQVISHTLSRDIRPHNMRAITFLKTEQSWKFFESPHQIIMCQLALRDQHDVLRMQCRLGVRVTQLSKFESRSLARVIVSSQKLVCLESKSSERNCVDGDGSTLRLQSEQSRI